MPDATDEFWELDLRGKPDFTMAMKRIYAWYDQAIIDRTPIRFSEHNVDFSAKKTVAGKSWKTIKDKWFDARFQVDYFIESIEGQIFNAETFPVFWPNLGPEVYTAFYGAELEFQEVTSYSVPLIHDWEEAANLELNHDNVYFRKIEELTQLALEKCEGLFMVGYTDLHPGVD